MTLPNEPLPVGLLGTGAAGGYQIERSLRFNSSDTSYLFRNPASAGNRKTWTWAGWVKISNVAQSGCLFSSFIDSANHTSLTFLNGNFQIQNRIANVNQISLFSTGLYRDPSAWYHLVLSVDAANTTLTLYVNGAADPGINGVTISSTDTYVNSVNLHSIGSRINIFFNGYLADVHFIDGQALTPSSFGETDANGIWQPKAYTGSYGTNGFQLKFADNSAATATTLGKDYSGNGNNWTPINLSVTAGAGNDSLVDSPTNYGTDTGAGGEVRGNYATLNPLNIAGGALANGNLDLTNTGGGRKVGTVAVSSGKWYWEVTVTSTGDAMIGIMPPSNPANTASNNYLAGTANEYGYYGTNGQKYNNGSGVSYGATYTSGDVIGIALNMDAGTLIFYKNNTSQGTAFSGLSGTFAPAASAGGSSGASMTANFGQRPFAYTAPSGFKALCTQNLPAPTITKPSTVMDVALWTGNGSARSITGLGFNPDLVWIKMRSSGVTDHALYDSVRGATIDLVSNSNAAETTQTQGLTAFNSDGFSLGTLAKVNTNTEPYVGWAWDAGSSTVTNTQGSITSQVRANASAGFSIQTWTGSGVSTSWGHGLGIRPELVIVKHRSSAEDWFVWHKLLTSRQYLLLNSTAAVQSFQNQFIWGPTGPSSSLVYFLASIGDYVSYCFAPVAGYSAFGSYTGNGSADGPFVYTGMLPRWIMVKRSDSTGDWTIIDTARRGYNVSNDQLYPNLADKEGKTDLADILSNGFKLRNTDASVNASAGTYIYTCFASNPFLYSRAR